MQFDIITIFPDFFAGPLDFGIVPRAREARLMEVRVHDLRAYAHDRHRTVDDRPFGGGEGLVLKPEPLFEAVESLLGDGIHREEPGEHGKDILDREIVGARFTENVPRERHAVAPHDAVTRRSSEGSDASEKISVRPNTAVVLLSASGKLFCQEKARGFAQPDRIILLCGGYEDGEEEEAQTLWDGET